MCLDYTFFKATGLFSYALLHDIISNGSLQAELARLQYSSSDCCLYLLKGGYFEEAQICRERELQLKARLTGPVGVTSAMLPVVSSADVEAVVSVWSGVPVEQMSTDEMKRLRQLQASLKVCTNALFTCCMHVTYTVDTLALQCRGNTAWDDCLWGATWSASLVEPSAQARSSTTGLDPPWLIV